MLKSSFCTALLLLFIVSAIPCASQEQETDISYVSKILAKMSGNSWSFQGSSRHGQQTKQITQMEKGPGENCFVGKGKTWVDNELVGESAVMYSFHPKKGRWIYTSASSDGSVQEAEEIESTEAYFVFKGTAYRLDGSQTSFVWKITLLDDSTFLSESMAYYDGSWQDNPSGKYSKIEK